MPTAKAKILPSRSAAGVHSSWEKTIWPWMQAHRILIGGGIAVVVCLLLLFAYRGYERRLRLEDLRSGVIALQSGDSGKALAPLGAAARSWSNEKLRLLGLLYLGEAYNAEGQKENALKAYEQVLSITQRNEEDFYLGQLALWKLGREAEQKGDLAQARQWYEQAANTEGLLQAEAIMAAARVLEKTSEHSAAMMYYEKFLAQFPNSPLLEVVQEKAGK